MTPCWQFQSDKQSSDDNTLEHSSISLESNGPLYENTLGCINPPPLLLSYESEEDVTDHIYDDIDTSRPANIFLSLVNGEGTTISPDPNIYEVPPGAIFHRESQFEELFPLRNISPPNGFQDKLTWERIHLIGEGKDNNEAIYSLPIKFSLKGSAIVKPRKKKRRPGIEELLNQITIMKDSATEEVWKDPKSGQESTPQHELTKDLGLKSENVSSVSGDSESVHIGCAISNYSSSNEVIVENIDQVMYNDLTVLERVDDLTVAPIDSSVSEENRPSETANNKEFTSVIEISGDGTWNTATIPASHVDSSKSCDSATTDDPDQDFLSASSDVRAKHVNLAYSGQYYTSKCPVASIKPMKYDTDVAIDTKKNIGAQIMEKYNEERKKIIEMKNLPDVSLLDVDESLEEIQKERRKIIESQAVRAKRIDSWIKGRPITLDENGDPIKFEGEQEGEEPGSGQDPNSINMYLDENGEVVYDSIIENKSKIKSYWEQLMLAAELASQHPVPKNPPQQPPAAPPVPTHNEKVHSPDLSETEFYDALSHVSAVQTPDLEKDIEDLKLTETVVERDIRIQQERELALIIERQKALKSAKTSAMKEKEDDLHRSPHQQPDEAYLSIPTTDEGNFSEYGSEDKEDHSPDGSRVTSPVVPAGMNSHHRTQSLDSMSSGHSSGSGTVSHSDLCPTRAERRQTFGPVKPIDEPQEIDILTFVKGNPVSLSKGNTQLTETADIEVNNSQTGYDKETPIEREIRLTREREEELRREKRISTTLLTSGLQKNEPEKKKEVIPKTVKQTIEPATQRVQHEIELATEREKDLNGWSSDELEKEVNKKMLLKPTATKPKVFPITVTQNGDINKKSLTSPQINQIGVESIKSPTISKTSGASPKLYIQNPQQKGLMKRFLASRGKMGSSPRLNSISSPTSATLPPLKTSSTSPSSYLSESFFSFTSLVQTKDREEPANLGARPGYKSAEDKIQSELREMKRREEELRQQCRSNLYSARSQPDLLNIVNDPITERELSLEEDEPTRLPNTSKLRSALSVQNLLDVDDKPAPRRTPKRKSALIEQWENRIQNNN